MTHFPVLLCFVNSVDRVVGASLAGHGFRLVGTSPTRATYGRDGALVSLAYFDEDLPSPAVAVDVGLATDDGSPRVAGLWRALGDGEPSREYSRWRFHDEESPDDVLRRLVAEVLPAAEGLLADPERLAGFLADQVDEAETRYLEDRRRADLVQARRAFDEGRFQDAVDGLVLLGPESLSAADRRRLRQARDWLAP